MKYAVAGFGFTTLLTILLYLAFRTLAVARLDPIIFVSKGLSLSASGLLVWLILLFLYAAISAVIIAKLLHVNNKKLMTTVAAFGASCLYVVFFHPTFLLAVLPETIRHSYVDFIVKHISFLERIYFHAGIFQYAPYVILGHALIVFAIAYMLNLRGPGGPSAGSQIA